ncbi:MAG: RNA pyrophosphohydrolase [Alphaproteobacteria bacterium]|nr:RNA pyrophosphohydrolase [Alphaproteobacteria bacterium]NCQ67667.1 RNA pyrophosphohydrolase [Alphaproteobacteria bacterium]NCT07571.1 RNA pyrophosphohydrolase [Alphaproteobacteria bacterium]
MKQNSPKDLSLYRPNVGIMLLNKEGKVFVAQRLDSPGPAWQMPQGGIDEGEDYRAAALRELEEETSISHVEILKESRGWYHYDLPPELQGKIWGGEYVGQRQKWFLMRYSGEDSDINLKTSHPEFSSWKWVDAKNLTDLAVSFKVHVYKSLVKEFL